MNIKTLIHNELWLAISNTYEVENYSAAILDAMHYLSKVIREKSGLDGDGHNLVGAAFGGQSPILRVNKLQTETERNVQKGIEQILRGMYQGIRNPRSHEKIQDSKNTADAIIYFVNYLLGVIDQSQEPFTISRFLDRVLDKHFVKSSKYAELLVSEVPHRKYLDVLIEIFRRKLEGDGRNIELVAEEILKVLPQEQLPDFISLVSEELKTTSNDAEIRLTLRILTPPLWKLLETTARMRAENILIESIKEGSANSTGKTTKGALGTWAGEFLQYFELKNQAGESLLAKLNGTYPEQLYVFSFFLNYLPLVYEVNYSKRGCVKAICKAVKDEDFESDELANRLKACLWSFPEDWRELIRAELPNLSSPEDDIPF